MDPSSKKHRKSECNQLRYGLRPIRAIRAVLTSLLFIGKVTVNGEEYSINDEFKQNVLNLSDEVEINEIEAAAIVLDSQDDPGILGRSLLECSIIRFHQHRKYVLDIIRLLIDLDREAETENGPVYDYATQYLREGVFAVKDSQRIVPRCMVAMKDVRAWIQKLNDKITAAAVLAGGQTPELAGELETVEFSRVSLIQQHELMAIIMCRAIETNLGQEDDFKSLLAELKATDKYDSLLGTFILAARGTPLWFASLLANTSK